MNVLLKEHQDRVVAKVTDFGLSKSKISKVSKDKAGTSSYKAPEVGEESLTGAVDIFSFGGVLVFLFGDRHVHPFSDLQDGDIERHMVRCYELKKDPRVPEIDSIGDDMIQSYAKRCFSVNPDDRPSAQELLEEFSQLCGLSATSQLNSALEDAMIRLHMRSFDMLNEQVRILTERLLEKDMEIDDLELRVEFLLDKHIDSI